MKTVGINEFVKRQADPSFTGTVVTLGQLEKLRVEAEAALNAGRTRKGYAPFVEIATVKDPGILAPVLKIDDSNRGHLKTEMTRRREGEEEYLQRYFSGDHVKGAPSHHVDIVMYSKGQLESEKESYTGADYDIITVLAEPGEGATPMTPETMRRNIRGPAYGGSGYQHSAEEMSAGEKFWSEHAVVRPGSGNNKKGVQQMNSIGSVIRVAASKWMQESAEKQEASGTKGALRSYFGLKEGEKVTMGMLDKEISRLEKKYPDGGYADADLKLFRRLQQARRFMEAGRDVAAYDIRDLKPGRWVTEAENKIWPEHRKWIDAMKDQLRRLEDDEFPNLLDKIEALAAQAYPAGTDYHGKDFLRQTMGTIAKDFEGYRKGDWTDVGEAVDCLDRLEKWAKGHIHDLEQEIAKRGVAK